MKDIWQMHTLESFNRQLHQRFGPITHHRPNPPAIGQFNAIDGFTPTLEAAGGLGGFHQKIAAG